MRNARAVAVCAVLFAAWLYGQMVPGRNYLVTLWDGTKWQYPKMGQSLIVTGGALEVHGLACDPTKAMAQLPDGSCLPLVGAAPAGAVHGGPCTNPTSDTLATMLPDGSCWPVVAIKADATPPVAESSPTILVCPGNPAGATGPLSCWRWDSNPGTSNPPQQPPAAPIIQQVKIQRWINTKAAGFGMLQAWLGDGTILGPWTLIPVADNTDKLPSWQPIAFTSH